jgi:hypothetical protein
MRHPHPTQAQTPSIALPTRRPTAAAATPASPACWAITAGQLANLHCPTGGTAAGPRRAPPGGDPRSIEEKVTTRA